MSVCTFIASDKPLSEYSPLRDYPFNINIDTGMVDDGGADDNCCLHQLDCFDYTDKKYAVGLEWRYTEGRAAKIVDYIRENLKNADSIELWHVWLG